MNFEEKNPSSDSFLRFLVIFSLETSFWVMPTFPLALWHLVSVGYWCLGNILSSKFWCLRNIKVPKIVDKEKSQKFEMQVALTQVRSCHHNHNCRCCWESILFRVLWGKQHLKWNWIKMRTASSVTVPLFVFLYLIWQIATRYNCETSRFVHLSFACVFATLIARVSHFRMYL